MDKFEEEIQNFQRYGIYEYKFDEGGNLVFRNPSSDFNEKYLSIPLVDVVYNERKINSFYEQEFKEFIPTITETTTETVSETAVSNEVSQLQVQNQDLQNKLATLIVKADENVTESERLAVKQIILDLRIALKQGNYERDFSTTFPYLPLIIKK